MRTAEESLEAIRQRMEEEQALGPKGILDIDCNASPEKMCEQPIENIYWQPGTAPKGQYETWVYLYQQRVDPEEKIRFDLEVRRGDRLVKTFRGRVGNHERTSKHFVFKF